MAIDFSRVQVQAAPPFDPSQGLDRLQESFLYAHYRQRPYWPPLPPSCSAGT